MTDSELEMEVKMKWFSILVRDKDFQIALTIQLNFEVFLKAYN